MRPVGGHYSWQTPTQLQQLAGNTPDGVADDQVQVGGASTRERHCLIEVPGGSRRRRTVMIRDNLPSAVTEEPSGCQPATPQLPGSRQSRIPELRLRLQDPSGSFARLRSTKAVEQGLGAGARHSRAGEPGRYQSGRQGMLPGTRLQPKSLRLNCSSGGAVGFR